MSDLATAEGKTLLLSALQWDWDQSRLRSYKWPSWPHPPSFMWSTWTYLLNYISHGEGLIKPLGPWVSTSHQQGSWFHSQSKEVFHVNHATSQWFKYHPIASPSSRPTWHRCKLWYQEWSECADPPSVMFLLPTTISYAGSSSIFTSSPGPPFTNNVPSSDPQPIWDTSQISPIWSDTPHFFQWLIRPSPPTPAQCEDIAIAINQDGLLACSNGAYDKSAQCSSHG